MNIIKLQEASLIGKKIKPISDKYGWGLNKVRTIHDVEMLEDRDGYLFQYEEDYEEGSWYELSREQLVSCFKIF